MNKYYMTGYRHSEISLWDTCKAKTLQGAKLEATARFGDGFIDTIIIISEKVDGQMYELASKKPRDRRWWTYK